MNNKYSLICTKSNVNFELTKPAISLGRGDEADMRLDDNDASRLHAKIFTGLGGVTLVDMDSRNGTFVNDHKISEPMHIIPGDIIRIGHNEFRLSMEDLSESTRIAKVADVTKLGLPTQKSPTESPLSNFLGLFPFLKHNITQDLDQNEFEKTHATTINKYIKHFQGMIAHGSALALFFYNREKIIAVQCVTRDKQNVWAIGRSENNYIVISDPSISKYHAQLSYENNFWTLTDKDSKNGLRLQGKRLEQIAIKDALDIRLGDVKLYVRLL